MLELHRTHGFGVRPRLYSLTKSSMTSRGELALDIEDVVRDAQPVRDGPRVLNAIQAASRCACWQRPRRHRSRKSSSWRRSRRARPRTSMAAATDESTPPDIATRMRCRARVVLMRGPGRAYARRRPPPLPLSGRPDRASSVGRNSAAAQRPHHRYGVPPATGSAHSIHWHMQNPGRSDPVHVESSQKRVRVGIRNGERQDVRRPGQTSSIRARPGDRLQQASSRRHPGARSAGQSRPTSP